MIKVLITSKNDYINSIEIKGHANFNEHGKDIVCAAVSSAVLTSVNLILSLNELVNYQENEGYVLIKVLKHDDLNDKILMNLVNVLTELSKDYPKNIKIREEE